MVVDMTRIGGVWAPLLGVLKDYQRHIKRNFGSGGRPVSPPGRSAGRVGEAYRLDPLGAQSHRWVRPAQMTQGDAAAIPAEKLAAGDSIRTIAVRLERAALSQGREVDRNGGRPKCKTLDYRTPADKQAKTVALTF